MGGLLDVWEGVCMGKLNKDNLRRTCFYLKKNGLKNTMYAVAERMQKKETDAYTYAEPGEEIIKSQKSTKWEHPVTFSVLVPIYRTPEKYFREMVESLLNQTYPYFQLILLDASEDAKEGMNIYAQMAEETKDNRICYYPLEDNLGIAENTNEGIAYATGEYIGLLDHDDLLTPDALYQMAVAIKEAREKGIELQMLYSDEDKCNSEANYFYEPHYKKNFDKDLLLTNNYICHFTVLPAKLFGELRLRGEYNGAQDFDLVLRVADKVWDHPERVCHIPKVLYHWRCHTDSTAANPSSKIYAYEAGKRAVESFVERRDWKAKVKHLKHLGFYGVEYEDDLFAFRDDVGAIGGSLLNKKKCIIAGMSDETGKVIYEGMPVGFSGYMNRAVLKQEAEVLDIRCMKVNPKCRAVLAKTLEQMHLTMDEQGRLSQQGTGETTEITIQEINRKVSTEIRKAGYCLIWDPAWRE